MNNQEKLNLLKQLLTWVGGMAAAGGWLTSGQEATAVNDIMVGLPALVSLGSICWSVYSHWNMVKIPEAPHITK